MRISLCRVAIAVTLVAASASAHGGQYRGAVTPVTLRPSTGGPGGPTGAGGVNTGGRAASGDATSWQVWWEFNKEQFLDRLPVDAALPVSGSDEFFLGSTGKVVRQKPLRAGKLDRRDRIAPALARVLQRERSRDLVTACLVGLAKCGVDNAEVDLEQLFTEQLRRSDQEVRETAALAFGIAGLERSKGLLSELLLDTKKGGRLLDKESVSDRTRAFAAYSLGMLGRRAIRHEVRQEVADLLLRILADDREDSRDVLIATVTGLGLLRPEVLKGVDKRLAWQVVDQLWAFYDRDMGKANQVVQAHVPTAVARLLGRGTSSAHQSAKRRLANELRRKKRRHNTILQSAALTLGQLCVPPEDDPEDEQFAEQLLRVYKDAVDQQTRFFAMIALGRIGGDSNRQRLLSLYRRAQIGTERPWVALALGLVANARAQVKEVDTVVSQLLLADLRETQNTSAQAAFAVSLGLTGDASAVPHLLASLQENEREQVLAGYLCTSLALIGDVRVAPTLTAVMQRSVRRPFLLQQSAVALGRLGDSKAAGLLEKMLGEHSSTAALSAIASALSLIGDRRAIPSLIKMMDGPNTDLSQLGRAFAAAALGGIADKEDRPWNAPLSRDVNYRARTSTLTNGRAGVLDIL